MRSLFLREVIEKLPATAVLIAQKDPGIAHALAHALRAHFAEVIVFENSNAAANPPELRTLLLDHPEVRVAVLDLELVDLKEVSLLARTFFLAIVCTHRSPDNRMWLAALNAGAVECCHPDDIHAIIRARRASNSEP
jgi:DNA-binding NarL/FixJ family response regulator